MKTTATTQTNMNTLVNAGFTNSVFLKRSAKYMADALQEGIRQSLNGMDINVEFITLTARSMAQTWSKAARQLIVKYGSAGSQPPERRFHYNNNTTLSHS